MRFHSSPLLVLRSPRKPEMKELIKSSSLVTILSHLRTLVKPTSNKYPIKIVTGMMHWYWHNFKIGLKIEIKLYKAALKFEKKNWT